MVTPGNGFQKDRRPGDVLERGTIERRLERRPREVVGKDQRRAGPSPGTDRTRRLDPRPFDRQARNSLAADSREPDPAGGAAGGRRHDLRQHFGGKEIVGEAAAGELLESVIRRRRHHVGILLFRHAQPAGEVLVLDRLDALHADLDPAHRPALGIDDAADQRNVLNHAQHRLALLGQGLPIVRVVLEDALAKPARLVEGEGRAPDKPITGGLGHQAAVVLVVDVVQNAPRVARSPGIEFGCLQGEVESAVGAGGRP